MSLDLLNLAYKSMSCQIWASLKVVKKDVLFIILATAKRNAFMLLPISAHNLEPSVVVV